MKKISVIVLCAVLVLSLTSCALLGDPLKAGKQGIITEATEPQTLEELYSYYDKVERGMTKAQIEEMFGAGVDSYTQTGEKTHTTYVNEKKSAGVSVIYSSDETVTAKILFYGNSEFLVKFCDPFEEGDIEGLDLNQTVENAVKVLGNGLELSCEYSINNPGGFSKIYSWFNADGSNLQLYTDDDIIKQVVLN